MCSYYVLSSPSFMYLTSPAGSLRRRFNASIPNLWHPFCSHGYIRSGYPKSSLSTKRTVYASIAHKSFDFSWVSSDPNSIDDFNGWAVVEASTPKLKKKEGSPTFILLGIGTSVAALLATFAYLSFSKKGFVLQFLNRSHGMVKPVDRSEDVEDAIASEANHAAVSDVVDNPAALEANDIKEEKLGRILIPVPVDSTQQEALLIMKKLKIIGDDMKADQLCTRREYARWLVRSNSLLERNPKHRIVPSISLSGSITSAFDDISVDDPDFEPIQSLAEAGIVFSKLSDWNINSHMDYSEGQEGIKFFPERFVSRQDLINWKAKLEYGVMPGLNEEISRIKLDFMDIKEVSSDASKELFMDMMAGERSILRKVFGQIKRFQPSKPATMAQVVVALTCGRMVEAIHTELSRLEAENTLQKTAMEEIRYELLERGYIQIYWDKMMEEEKSRGLLIERAYLEAANELEQEKVAQERTLAEFLKEKTAMECQKQLLSSLKEEVNEMSEKFACESTKYIEEHRNLQSMLSDLKVKLEGMLDVKSILEAEVEALRILRSWIEDEARKSQARAKVLEEVGRRWKWEKS